MRVTNPIFRADMPDPDIIRRGDTYYMVSTTMFYMPGGAILKSKDLAHWELVSHIFDKLEDNDIYELKNGKHAYGKGQWATSLIYYRERYYACFVCHDLGKTFIYHTDDIEKTGWDRVEMGEVFHDMSFLLWEGKPYLVYGNGTIGIAELKEDLGGLKEGGLRQVLLETPREGMHLCCEGCRAYVRNGWIYLSFIDIPSLEVGNGRRRQVCYRSRNLLGPYERKIIMDDDWGLPRRGVAQGPFIETEKGEWYACLFQDRGAAGRMPFLMPMVWEEDWPVLGDNGRIPSVFETDFEEWKAKPLIVGDTLCHEENTLGLTWQWNHNPIPEGWSFTENPGWLRLTNRQKAGELLKARNTLTQRTCEPWCAFTVELDASGLKDGDYAGLCALQSQYGQVGVRKSGDKREIVLTTRDGDKRIHETEADFSGERVFLRIEFDYRELTDKAGFFYSTDGSHWIQIGDLLQMRYTLDLFVGYRIGMFCYGEKEEGGTADFRNFVFEENTKA